MIDQSYRVKVNMGWEFIILGRNEEEVIDKLGNYLNSLIPLDGFTSMAMSAKENIENKEYMLEEFDGFVIAQCISKSKGEEPKN